MTGRPTGPLRERTITTRDGTALRVQESGLLTGPALLLLPGQNNSHAWWNGLRDAFGPTHRTITFDYRGTGESAVDDEALAAEPDWSTASFAVDAVAVLDALRVRRADVYGASMGGRVAQQLAGHHLHRVRRLVLACSSPGGRLSTERGNDVRRLLASPDSRERSAAVLALFYTDDWPRDRGTNLLGDPTMTPAASARHLKVSNDHDASGLLGRITCPTLVLHGTDDAMVPTVNGRVLANRIPRARLELTPRGRHGFFDEFAADVTPRVQAFLAQR